MLKKLVKIVFFIIICIIVGLPIINKIYNSYIHSISDLKHTQITDNCLDGKLDLEYDYKGNNYWLFYRNVNKNTLVWQDGDIHGNVNVKVSGKNKIDIIYDYYPQSAEKDKTITLDLSKGETYHTNFWRSFFE